VLARCAEERRRVKIIIMTGMDTPETRALPRRMTMAVRERRSLRATANWQVWTVVFVVLVLIMIVWLLLG
jgi:hypothetical protein